LFVLVLLIGCNTSKAPKGRLSGTVLYKGQPVNGATLVFFPSSGSEVSIIAGQDGSFDTGPIPDGDYKVVVQPDPGDPGPNIENMTPDKKAKMREQLDKLKRPATTNYPEKYKKKETSTLSVTIKGPTKSDLPLSD
jgi:hypothetical protein